MKELSEVPLDHVRSMLGSCRSSGNAVSHLKEEWPQDEVGFGDSCECDTSLRCQFKFNFFSPRSEKCLEFSASCR